MSITDLIPGVAMGKSTIILIIVFACLSFSGFAFYKGLTYGENKATVEWSQKYNTLVQDIATAKQLEQDRQKKINDEFVANSQQKIGELQTKINSLEEQLAKNEEEAQKDPKADVVGISRSATSRINRVR